MDGNLKTFLGIYKCVPSVKVLSNSGLENIKSAKCIIKSIKQNYKSNLYTEDGV